MSGKRTYGDSCGIARALDVIGERWALLVVRDLLLGPKRFTDLRDGLPKVGPDILTQRLRELADAGLVGRRKLDPPAGAWVYELTDRGRELEPVILALGRWGAAAPFPEGEPPLGPDSMALALKTVFESAKAGRGATYELELDGQPFTVRVGGGELALERGRAPEADARIATDPQTLTKLLWRGLELAEAERSGTVSVVGDRRAVAGFLRTFAA
jgi:DNA-binding HxlR family transcriptional regulator